MRTKLLYIPRLYGVEKHEYTDKHTFCPPLGISVLTAALREHGFSADQDDLDAKVFFRNWDARPNVEYRLDGFDDSQRIKHFLETGSDAELEREAKRMLSLTRLRGYDTIGLSTCGQHNFSTVGVALVMAKLIKQRYGSTIILGGLNPGSPPYFDSIINSPIIDFVVTGHADATLLNLSHALEHDKIGTFRLDCVFSGVKLNGTAEPPYHQSEQRFYVPEFEGLPIYLYRYHPLREFSRDEVGHFVSSKSILVLPYYFLIGCPFNCAFCGESFTDAYRVKPVDKIIADLAMLKRKYHARHFFFLNDMVNPSREFAREFARALIKADLDICWSDCAHFGCLDRELLTDLKASGAVRLIYGLESGSERLLRYVNKHFTLKQASDILKWSHDLGIWNEIDVLCGLPTETPEDVRATGGFILDNLDHINYCHPNRFQLKHSQFLKNPERFGLEGISRIQHRYHSYSFEETGGLGWKQKEKQIQRSFEQILELIGKHLVGTKGTRLYRSNQNLPFIFYLYDLLGNKRDVEAVIHDRWSERSAAACAVNRRSRLPGYVYGAYHRVRRMIGR